MEKSALTDVSPDQLLLLRKLYVSQYNSGPIAMHEPYKSNDISYKNTFGIKKVQPNIVESYLEVNT